MAALRPLVFPIALFYESKQAAVVAVKAARRLEFAKVTVVVFDKGYAGHDW